MKLKIIKRKKMRLIPNFSYCTCFWYEWSDGLKHYNEILILWLGYGLAIGWHDNRKWKDPNKNWKGFFNEL